jgi:predicted metal-dependent HD superfamily phosphohydrolase
MTNPNDLLENLFLQWQLLWSCIEVNQLFVNNQLSISEVAVNQAFANVAAKYSKPERHYHNLQHIHHVLQLVQTLQNKTQDLPVVQLAAWFHDVVYASKADNNEENSAKYANYVLTSFNISPSVINKVTALIINRTYVSGAWHFVPLLSHFSVFRWA